MRKFRRKTRGPVVAKKVMYDGIEFASNLEKYMYCALKESGLQFEYEPRSYSLIEPFVFTSSSYERQSNGKGQMVDRGNKKVQGIKYKPDFEGEGWTIEVKGRANETFPIRWKLFKRLIQKTDPNRLLLKPQNQKECDEVVQIIKEYLNQQL